MGEYGRLEIQLTQDKFACQRKVAQIPVTTTNILYIANLMAMNKKKKRSYSDSGLYILHNPQDPPNLYPLR